MKLFTVEVSWTMRGIAIVEAKDENDVLRQLRDCNIVDRYGEEGPDEYFNDSSPVEVKND